MRCSHMGIQPHQHVGLESLRFGGLLQFPTKFWDEVAGLLFTGDFCQAGDVLSGPVYIMN